MALHRRLQVNLIVSTDAKAIQIRDDIKTKVAASDLWTAEDLVFKKNLDIEKRIDDEGRIVVVASYLFLSNTKAQQVFDFIKANLPAGVVGVASLHHCPEEGTIGDWQGCKTDPRADYQEVVV